MTHTHKSSVVIVKVLVASTIRKKQKKSGCTEAHDPQSAGLGAALRPRPHKLQGLRSTSDSALQRVPARPPPRDAQRGPNGLGAPVTAEHRSKLAARRPTARYRNSRSVPERQRDGYPGTVSQNCRNLQKNPPLSGYEEKSGEPEKTPNRQLTSGRELADQVP